MYVTKSNCAVLLVTCAVWGCVDVPVYRCSTDAECTLDEVQGSCELDDPTIDPSDVNRGLCAFPDGACGSGRRFGEFAGDHADACVQAMCGNHVREPGEECDAPVP